MKPLTIIMVTRNNIEAVKKALTSLKEHTDPKQYKLLFMDNGGHDHTDAWIVDYCRVNEIELKYNYNSDNIGYIGAVNKAYSIVDTEYALTVHDDVIFCKQWLDNMMRRFRNSNVAAVGPVISFAMGPQAFAIANMTIGCSVKYLLGLFFLARMDVLREVRDTYYDGKEFLASEYGLGDKEELELCYRIRQLGYKLSIARDVYIEHIGEKTFIDELGSKKAFTQYQDEHLALLRDRLGEDVVNDIFTIKIEKPVKLMIGILTRTEYVHYRNVISLLKIWGVTQVTKSFQHIARAHPAMGRNRIVKEFLKTDFTHLLFIDDDMTFEQDAVLKLLAHDVDICTGVAYQRVQPHAPCTFLYNASTKFFYPVECAGKGLVQVDATGGYFFLIKRHVLEGIEKPWFVYGDTSLGFHDSNDPDDRGIGEDVYFGAKAKLNGFEVWVDGDIEIPHIGINKEIDSKYYEEYKDSGQLEKDLKSINEFKKM